MKSELTPEQIERYQQDGVVVIEGLLDAEELQTWRTHVDAAVADRQDRKLANGDMKSGDYYYDKVFTQRLNLWVDHAGMRGLMLDPRLGRMAAELAGVDGIRIWHDQALIKEPWANPTAWHLSQANPRASLMYLAQGIRRLRSVQHSALNSPTKTQDENPKPL